MDIVSPVVDRVQADSQVMSRNLAFYGYEGYTNATFELNQPSDYTAYTLDNTTQDFTGTMPAENLEITYSYGRDDRYWAKLVFEAGESGVLRGRDDEDDGTAYRDEVSKDVSPAANASSSRTATFNTKVLANIEGEDANEAAYTWQEIVDKKLVPQVKADKYYRVKGWAIDENKDGVYDASVDTLLTDDSWFTKPLSDTDYTIYVVAVYEENPLEWIDITFKVDNGSLAAGTDGIVHSTMHIQYDKTWQDVIARADFPQTTAIANYLPSQWHDSDNKVMGAATAEDDMNLQHHGTVFTFVYYKDPSVFGTYASTPQATAMLDSSGKGNVIVHGTTSGYQYIITDRDGNIIGIQNGNSAGTNIFEDMNPGSEYKVYEALGETDASIGGRIEDVKISEEASLESAEYGTSVSFLSNPATVLVPAVETNYQVRFDTENDGRTVLVINPADPDSDYALVDKDGNPVVTPETDGSGWQTPAGSPAKVTFTGLDYNASYTVVTRPSGDGNVGVNDKLDQGTSLMTDPSGDLDIPAYVVETINGAITKAGDFEGSSTREDVEAGDTITVKAEAKNDDNRDFLYWKVLVGSIPDLGGTGGKIEQQEITFTMPETNVVMAAYYQSSSNPSIDSEVRGGNAQEMALDPSDADSLRDALTTDADQTLIDVNGAKIEYKIVYRKTSVRATETEAVKESGWYNDEYAEAYHGAWGLSVEAERYVDGRRVDRATPAEATFTTYVQLDGDDVDMLDYMLFRVDEDPTEDGQYILTEESFDGLDGIETEHEGGLFTFEAQLGKRYILVYNKANWIYFINNHVSPIYSYGFKARKGEPVSDSLFFDGVEEQVDYLLDEQTGVEYNYIGWSSQEDDYREYDPEKDIKKKTFIYAYYDDTKEEVDSTRDELYEAIMDLLSKSEDYFMKQAEASELRELVDEALALLEQTEPRATIGQLNEILLKVQESIVQSDEVLEERYDNYDQIKTHSSGSGGGGGGGKKGNSFVQERSTVYGTGNVNGSWSIDETTGRTTFVLTGGLPLTSSWAILENPNGTDISKGWYHFDSSGNMDIGWFTDEKGDWYYSSPVQDDKYGQMQTSWHIGDGDTHWYYLDPTTGAMAKGWVMVDGKWYYFTEKSEQPSYTSVDGVLQYTGNGARPMGSMYVNEMTPDGYMVGADGAWIQ
jgi:glucan-binding YG repeat protein